MDLYDIVAPGCNFRIEDGALLGFRKIFVGGKDFSAADLDSKGKRNEDAAMFIGSNERELAAHAKYGKFILPARIVVSAQLLARIKDNEAVLCMPMERITLTYGLVRTKNIYLMKKTFRMAKRLGAKISFASMASSPSSMNSAGQLIELGKLISGNEEYVRRSLGIVNKSIADV